MGISEDLVLDLGRISRNQALNQQETKRESSVQIRFRIQKHVVKATDPSDTKLGSDRVPTTDFQKKSTQSAFIRVDPCPIEMGR